MREARADFRHLVRPDAIGFLAGLGHDVPAVPGFLQKPRFGFVVVGAVFRLRVGGDPGPVVLHFEVGGDEDLVLDLAALAHGRENRLAFGAAFRRGGGAGGRARGDQDDEKRSEQAGDAVHGSKSRVMGARAYLASGLRTSKDKNEFLRFRSCHHRRGFRRRAGDADGGAVWRQGRCGRGISRRRHVRDSRLRAEEVDGLCQPLRRGFRGCGGVRLACAAPRRSIGRR